MKNKRKYSQEQKLMDNCPNCGQEVNCKFVESVIDEIVADVREENIDLTTEILQVKSFKEGHQVGGEEERERIRKEIKSKQDYTIRSFKDLIGKGNKERNEMFNEIIDEIIKEI